jgi:hypothetical protein
MLVEDVVRLVLHHLPLPHAASIANRVWRNAPLRGNALRPCAAEGGGETTTTPASTSNTPDGEAKRA